MAEFDKYFQRFEALVRKYWALVDPDETKNIDLKHQHSLRVLENTRRIAGALNPGQRQLELCHLAALFHDAGRFPQIYHYKTFYDHRSVNHGALGAATLVREHILDDLPPRERRILLACTALHNKRFVPAGLPQDIHLPLTVTRDADKLDILPVMLEHFAPGGPKNSVVTLSLTYHPTAYTPAVLDSLFAGRQANYWEMVYINDFKLLLLSWIHDIVHPESLTMIRQAGYMDTIMASLPEGQAMEQVKEYVRGLLKERV